MRCRPQGRPQPPSLSRLPERDGRTEGQVFEVPGGGGIEGRHGGERHGDDVLVTAPPARAGPAWLETIVRQRSCPLPRARQAVPLGSSPSWAGSAPTTVAGCAPT